MGRGPLASALNFGVKLISALSVSRPTTTERPPTYTTRVLDSFPHDPAAFTQGLCFDAASGTLLESTGLYGGSSVRRVELRSGRVLQRQALPRDQFGEGLTLHRGRCVQLLWHGGKGLVRDPSTFAVRQQFDLPEGCKQGWGLTHDEGDELYLSDGSANIYVLDAATFALRRRLAVRAGSRPLRSINELQYIRGELWANLWGDDHLAVIDPSSGRVRRYVDCSSLLSPQERQELRDPNEHVLNGIAHDPLQDRLFVTGKCWPRMYQISVHAPQGSREETRFAGPP